MARWEVVTRDVNGKEVGRDGYFFHRSARLEAERRNRWGRRAAVTVKIMAGDAGNGLADQMYYVSVERARPRNRGGQSFETSADQPRPEPPAAAVPKSTVSDREDA